MELISALQTGSEVINLTSALANLISEAKVNDAASPNEPPTSLTELLRRLQIEAVSLSRAIENQLRILSGSLEEYGLNPAKSLEQQFADLSWYNWLRRSKLKSFREEVNSIYRQLTSFVDDATAILVCEGDVELAAQAFTKSFGVKRDLDRLFGDSDLSLGMLIDGMLATAGRVTAELQAA